MDRSLAAKAARELPTGVAAACDILRKVIAGEDMTISGYDLVMAIKAAANPRVQNLGTCIHDPGYDNNWIVFLKEPSSSEITFEVVYSAVIYRADFVRKIIAFAETGYGEFWREEIQCSPRDVARKLAATQSTST